MKQEIREICDKMEGLGMAYEEYENLLQDQSRSSEFEHGSLLAVLNEKYTEINQELCRLTRM